MELSVIVLRVQWVVDERDLVDVGEGVGPVPVGVLRLFIGRELVAALV